MKKNVILMSSTMSTTNILDLYWSLSYENENDLLLTVIVLLANLNPSQHVLFQVQILNHFTTLLY